MIASHKRAIRVKRHELLGDLQRLETRIQTQFPFMFEREKGVQNA